MPVVSRFIRELAVSALPVPEGDADYREPRYRGGKTMNQYAAAVSPFYMSFATGSAIGSDFGASSHGEAQSAAKCWAFRSVACWGRWVENVFTTVVPHNVEPSLRGHAAT